MTHQEHEAQALVLVGYAATMEAVQRFEFVLKELAVQKDQPPSKVTPDAAWRRVEKLLRQPMGWLSQAAPPELAGRLPELKRIRNHLAHDVLLRWRFERNLGLCTDDEVVAGLIEVEQEVAALAALMDEAAAGHLRALGISKDEMHVDRAEMRRHLGSKSATKQLRPTGRGRGFARLHRSFVGRSKRVWLL
jgi:hypothetical protein